MTNDAPLPARSFPPPGPQDAVPPPPEVPAKRSRKGCWIGLVSAIVLVLGGCAALIAVGLNESSDQLEDLSSELEEDLQGLAETIDDEDIGGEAGDEKATSSAQVSSSIGGREEPYAYDSLTTIEFDVFGDADGSVWNVMVSPIDDITAEVEAENEFNDPPPAGVVFAGYDVEMTLVEAEKEPLSSGFNVVWEIIGAQTAAVYDGTTIETESFGCGVSPNEFDVFAEAYVGGTLAGTVCIPLPQEDLDDPGTQVALNFGGDRIHFGPDGGSIAPVATPQPAAAFSSSASDGSREGPLPYEESTTVRFETFGDADGSQWEVTIGALTDVTDRVLSSNQFNEPPPDEAVFAGFDVEMTLLEADKEPLSPGFNFSWEVVGGATARAYGSATLSSSFTGCGVLDGEFNDFAEVFSGGTLSGVVCVPIPAVDLTNPNTRVAMNFSDGDRVHFG